MHLKTHITGNVPSIELMMSSCKCLALWLPSVISSRHPLLVSWCYVWQITSSGRFIRLPLLVPPLVRFSFLRSWTANKSSLSLAVVSKTWILKCIFPSYWKTRNSLSFKKWSTTNFDHPVDRNAPSEDLLILTGQRHPLGPSRMTFFDASSDICFRKFGGIFYSCEESMHETSKPFKTVCFCLN